MTSLDKLLAEVRELDEKAPKAGQWPYAAGDRLIMRTLLPKLAAIVREQSDALQSFANVTNPDYLRHHLGQSVNLEALDQWLKVARDALKRAEEIADVR